MSSRAAGRLLLSLGLLGWSCRETAPTVGMGGSPPPSLETPGAATRVMPLGDSITQADRDHASYRRPLWQMLQAAGYWVDFVGSHTAHHRGDPPQSDFDRDHEGHWGFRADEILEQLDGWAARSRPQVVLVHLGSNDLFQGQDVDGTAKELGDIIDRLRAVDPAVKILLARIIPADSRAIRPRIEELNDAIGALASRKTTALSPVVAVDHYSGFDPREDAYDGVHPDVGGEVKMAQRWFDALGGILDRP